MSLDARRSTPDVVTDSLRAAILTGAIAGGAPLRQNDVATQFGISVVPVREAFQRLVAEGLAEHRPNRGVLVTALVEADLTEIAELRTLLEPHALRLSAPHLSVNDLAAAEAVLHQAAGTNDLLERARLHWEFHRTLYSRARRPRVLDQLAFLHTSLSRCLLPAWSRVGMSSGWVDSHLLILSALRRSNVDKACAEVVRQIAEAAERMHAGLDRTAQEPTR